MGILDKIQNKHGYSSSVDGQKMCYESTKGAKFLNEKKESAKKKCG